MSEQKLNNSEQKLNHSEILFLYDAKDCDPNGDPFTGEPRYDEDTQKIMVSDVRIKRYIRDYIDKYESKEGKKDFKPDTEKNLIFYSSRKKCTVGERRFAIADLFKDKKFEEDIKETEKKDKKKVVEIKKDFILKKFIDLRLFGCVLAEGGNNLDLTGSVQFKNLNRSVNQVDIQVFQNTNAMMKSGMEKEQGAIATKSIVPYALIAILGFVNPTSATENKVVKEDIELMLKALWHMINKINTRSKTGQTSRLLMKFNYKDQFSKIPDLEYGINLEENAKGCKSFRNFGEIEDRLNANNLISKLTDYKEKIKSIDYYYEKCENDKEFKNSKIIKLINSDKDLKEKLKRLELEEVEKKEE